MTSKSLFLALIQSPSKQWNVDKPTFRQNINQATFSASLRDYQNNYHEAVVDGFHTITVPPPPLTSQSAAPVIDELSGGGVDVPIENPKASR